jgi:hypothetical protein
VAALHVPPVGCAHTPLVHKATAVPVVGATLSVSENDAPEAVTPAVALQVLLPTVQLIACDAQAIGAGAAQVAAVGPVQLPLEQVYVAAPVVSVISEAIALAPSAAAATLALQVFAPTVQLCAAALHGRGALQLAFVAAPQAPLVQAKVAAPVVGAAVSDNTALTPDAVAADVALHVLPPTVQLKGLAVQPTGAAQVAPVAAPHTPLLQAKVAAPVVGAAVSDNTALAPEAVDAAAASQVLPPTVQLKADAAHATGAVHDTLVAAPHTPLVHVKLAAPVVGAVVSDKAAVAPEAVEAAVALHTLAPTLQLNAPEHGAAATGTAQVAEVAAPHTPLEHENVAAPVVGAVVSDSTALAPEAVAADVALHVLAPTVQLKVLAVQPTGAVQVAPVAAPQTPLVQANVAAPVVGAAVSDSTALAPEAVEAAAPSQVLPPTVQLNAAAAQATGAVHETLVAAPHTPLVQAKLAAPVVGAVVSDNAAVAPEAVAGAVALHVLAPTVQLKAPVAQAEGEVQVALVAAPHTPLVQVKLAEPVVGAVTSVTAAVEPEVETTSVELHVLLPTVQLAACATHEAEGATIGLP